MQDGRMKKKCVYMLTLLSWVVYIYFLGTENLKYKKVITETNRLISSLDETHSSTCKFKDVYYIFRTSI